MDDVGGGEPTATLGAGLAGNPTGLMAAARDARLLDAEDREQDQLAIQELQGMETRWGAAVGQVQGAGVDAKLAALYGWGGPAFSADEALRTFQEAAQTAVQLMGWAEQRGDGEARLRAERVMRCVHESFTALVAGMSWQGDDTAPLQSAEDILIRFARPQELKPKPIQQLYKFALVWCRRLKLRHRGDIVYREIVARGHRTRAWVPAVDVNGTDLSTLENLVKHIFTQRHSMAMHELWIGICTQAFTDKLRICVEADFPEVQTSREWLAFSDGLYSIYTDTFIDYDDSRFTLPSDLAACAYHPMAFAPAYFGGGQAAEEQAEQQQQQPVGGAAAVARRFPAHPLTEVPTPILDTIFDTQHFCGHTRFWLMAMMGRLMYWSGTLDNWQVCPYLKGAAGTGKSTLINFMTAVYNSADICIIGNDVQETFGLEGLSNNKLMWVAPEVRGSFSLDQGQFQSLVSNEEMMISQKHKIARMGAPRCHGMMAGNSLPNKYCDDSGSMQRRLPIFQFSRAVPKGHARADLLTKMKTQELAGIVRKINWCYQQAVVLVGTRSLWSSNILSRHMIDYNDQLSYDMSPLRMFLDKTVIKSAEVWCPEPVFQKSFKDFCKGHNFREPQWSSDLYDAPFKTFGVQVRRASYKWSDAEFFVQGNIVYGACHPGDWPRDGDALHVEGEENPRLDAVTAADVDLFEYSREEYAEALLAQ